MPWEPMKGFRDFASDRRENRWIVLTRTSTPPVHLFGPEASRFALPYSFTVTVLSKRGTSQGLEPVSHGSGISVC